MTTSNQTNNNQQVSSPLGLWTNDAWESGTKPRFPPEIQRQAYQQARRLGWLTRCMQLMVWCIFAWSILLLGAAIYNHADLLPLAQREYEKQVLPEVRPPSSSISEITAATKTTDVNLYKKIYSNHQDHQDHQDNTKDTDSNTDTKKISYKESLAKQQQLREYRMRMSETLKQYRIAFDHPHSTHLTIERTEQKRDLVRDYPYTIWHNIFPSMPHAMFLSTLEIFSLPLLVLSQLIWWVAVAWIVTRRQAWAAQGWAAQKWAVSVWSVWSAFRKVNLFPAHTWDLEIAFYEQETRSKLPIETPLLVRLYRYSILLIPLSLAIVQYAMQHSHSNGSYFLGRYEHAQSLYSMIVRYEADRAEAASIVGTFAEWLQMHPVLAQQWQQRMDDALRVLQAECALLLQSHIMVLSLTLFWSACWLAVLRTWQRMEQDLWRV